MIVLRVTGSSDNGTPLLRPYRHRDPARLSQARIAELEAHDARIALLESRTRAERPPPRDRRRGPRDTAARFGALRLRGVSVGVAATEVGVSLRQAQRWEAARKAAPRTNPYLARSKADHNQA